MSKKYLPLVFFASLVLLAAGVFAGKYIIEQNIPPCDIPECPKEEIEKKVIFSPEDSSGLLNEVNFAGIVVDVSGRDITLAEGKERMTFNIGEDIPIKTYIDCSEEDLGNCGLSLMDFEEMEEMDWARVSFKYGPEGLKMFDLLIFPQGASVLE